jgi:hypothetical protein
MQRHSGGTSFMPNTSDIRSGAVAQLAHQQARTNSQTNSRANMPIDNKQILQLHTLPHCTSAPLQREPPWYGHTLPRLQTLFAKLGMINYRIGRSIHIDPGTQHPMARPQASTIVQQQAHHCFEWLSPTIPTHTPEECLRASRSWVRGGEQQCNKPSTTHFIQVFPR